MVPSSLLATIFWIAFAVMTQLSFTNSPGKSVRFFQCEIFPNDPTPRRSSSNNAFLLRCSVSGPAPLRSGSAPAAPFLPRLHSLDAVLALNKKSMLPAVPLSSSSRHFMQMCSLQKCETLVKPANPQACGSPHISGGFLVASAAGTWQFGFIRETVCEMHLCIYFLCWLV